MKTAKTDDRLRIKMHWEKNPRQLHLVLPIFNFKTKCGYWIDENEMRISHFSQRLFSNGTRYVMEKKRQIEC
jgi:hypothetical protein